MTSPVRTPDGFKSTTNAPVYQQVTDADSPVDLTGERSSVIVQADSTAGAVNIDFPSAQGFAGTIKVQYPSIANSVTANAAAGETFNNVSATNTPTASGIPGTATYTPVRYSGGGFGWAVS
jgi:hypothetical protein